jgi:DNA-binding XRE family transcriptional regulator
MFHKAVSVRFLENTTLEVTFQDGIVKQYNMASLFTKYPQLKALEDRNLFISGKLMGAYGIIWNDELDIEAETIYADGVTVKTETNSINIELANAIYTARAKAGLSQKQVSELSGIDQSDFSKIERGIANPTISTLERISKAMGGKLSINIENKY